MGKSRGKEKEKDKDSSKKKVKKEKKKDSKKSKAKKEKKKSSSSDSAYESSSSGESAEQAYAKAIGATFGLKPQRLRLDRRVQCLSDLGVYQLATCISHVLPGLTEHGLMQIGGELYQVRRAATRSLKLGDDKESLEMKVRFTKAEASAERLWRSRMNDLLSQGAGMNPTTVISQHDSLVSLRRTIQSEVEKKKKAAEPQYTADMKTKIAEFERVAKEEMKRENQCNRPARDSRPSKPAKRRDSKKSRKKKEQSSSENSEESDLSEQDESDRDDMDDDDDDDEDEQPVPKRKKKKKQHVEDRRPRRGRGRGKAKVNPPSDEENSEGDEVGDLKTGRFGSRAVERSSTSKRLLTFLAPELKESVGLFLEGLGSGWAGDMCSSGDEAKQHLSKMSFVGKRQCKSLMEHLKSKLDVLQERLKKDPEPGAPETPVPKNLRRSLDDEAEVTPKGSEASAKGETGRVSSGDELGIPVVQRLARMPASDED